MATMKDVAKLAEVSVSTVSIVINGKAQERKIPQATYNKVMHAIEQLGYEPNVTARRLRNSHITKPTIAFYWPLDQRTTMLSALLTGIQTELERLSFDCELVIKTYINNKLYKRSKEIINNTYSGVIIGAASEQDMNYVETLSSRVPIVLINRFSDKYSTVFVDEKKVALNAIQLLLDKKATDVAVVKIQNSYMASIKRMSSFIDACSKNNITLANHHIIMANNTYSGGTDAAKKYLTLENRPKFIFCESDIIALGMNYYFNLKKINVPKDVSILSIGTIGTDATQYTTPSITTIDIPSEKIASAAISGLIDAISQESFSQKMTPFYKEIDPIVYIRDSF